MCYIIRNLTTKKEFEPERGQLLSFTKLSCHCLRRHHGLEGGPDSWRDRGAAGACSPSDHHKECGLHGALHPSKLSFHQQAAQQVLDGSHCREPSQGRSWQSTLAACKLCTE